MDWSTFDDVRAIAELLNIHQRIAEEGVQVSLAHLQSRQRALAAYCTCSAEQLADTIRIAGSPHTLAEWAHDDMLIRLLVIIEALRLAGDALWKDIPKDSDTTQTTDKPENKGTDHEEEH